MADEHDDTGARRIIAIFGTSRRRRHWVLAPRTTVVAAFGSVELDLRAAAVAGPVAEVQIVAVCGRVTLLVPPGADVELAGFAVAGTSDCTVAEAESRPALPPVRAGAVAVFGRVRVRSVGPEPDQPAAGRLDDAAPEAPSPAPQAPSVPAGVTAAHRTAAVPASPPDPAAAPPHGPTGGPAPALEPPRALAVGEVLRRALPVAVRVRRAAVPFPDAERQPAVVTAYREPGGRVVAAAVADHRAAVSLAAARSGEPASADEGAALNPAAVAAVGEVLGEAAALFRLAPDDDAPAPLHAEVARPAEGLPDEVARLLGAPAARADLVIEVEGQPGGALTFLVAA
jgi:hypothetical protein